MTPHQAQFIDRYARALAWERDTGDGNSRNALLAQADPSLRALPWSVG